MTTADRMAVLDKGVVQQVGTPATLYDEPANPFVAEFVGTMNLLPDGAIRTATSSSPMASGTCRCSRPGLVGPSRCGPTH